MEGIQLLLLGKMPPELSATTEGMIYSSCCGRLPESGEMMYVMQGIEEVANAKEDKDSERNMCLLGVWAYIMAKGG